MHDRTEKKWLDEGYAYMVGVDEVGRGALAGPVVACACILRPSGQYQKNSMSRAESQHMWSSIRDSKKISHRKRVELSIFIKKHYVTALGYCSAQEIDKLNIHNASLVAMENAVIEAERLYRRECSKGESVFNEGIVLIDGKYTLKSYVGAQESIVGGDDIVRCIGAASIIAKVERDTLMDSYSFQYKRYHLSKNKGYGTRQHREALSKLGPTDLHRKTFNPVKKMIQSA
jgi:ribonuclease HII